ncbi:hypothetical protein V6N13_077918 [Hibiscus sabdariffa]
MPTLCQQEAELLILTVLRRIDPYIEDILFTAAHVASISYEFKVDLSQWSRKDIEGSLFVVKRNTQPRFRFIVMNRWNTEYLILARRCRRCFQQNRCLLEGAADVFSRIDAYSKVPQVTSTNAADVPDSLAFLKLFNNRCLLEGAADVFSRIDAYSKVPQVTSTNAADVPDSLAFLKLFNNRCLLEGAADVFSRIDAYSKVPQVTSTNAADVPDSLAFLKLFNSIHRFLHIISLSAKMNEWILVVYLIRYCIVHFGIVDVFSRIDAYSKVPQVTSTNAADVPDSLAFLKLFNNRCLLEGAADVFSRIDAYSKVPQVTSTNAADVPDSLAFLKLFNTAMTIGSASNTAN